MGAAYTYKENYNIPLWDKSCYWLILWFKKDLLRVIRGDVIGNVPAGDTQKLYAIPIKKQLVTKLAIKKRRCNNCYNIALYNKKLSTKL